MREQAYLFGGYNRKERLSKNAAAADQSIVYKHDDCSQESERILERSINLQEIESTQESAHVPKVSILEAYARRKKRAKNQG